MKRNNPQARFLREVTLLSDRIPSPATFPYTLPAVKHLTTLALHPAVTFLLGENGAGKSTLLEAIAVAWGYNPEGGSKGFRFSTRTSHSGLHSCLRLVKGDQRPRDGYFFRAESFFNVATHIEKLDREPANVPRIISAYGNRSLHEQSHV